MIISLPITVFHPLITLSPSHSVKTMLSSSPSLSLHHSLSPSHSVKFMLSSSPSPTILLSHHHLLHPVYPSSSSAIIIHHHYSVLLPQHHHFSPIASINIGFSSPSSFLTIILCVHLFVSPLPPGTIMLCHLHPLFLRSSAIIFFFLRNHSLLPWNFLTDIYSLHYPLLSSSLVTITLSLPSSALSSFMKNCREVGNSTKLVSSSLPILQPWMYFFYSCNVQQEC